MNKEKTKVVFRVWGNKNGGDVIAIFPQIPADQFGCMCEMYEHVGQHGGGDARGVVSSTRLARPGEYRELAKELRGRGYCLQISKRCTAKDRKIRQADA
jgi:hypothetical protein